MFAPLLEKLQRHDALTTDEAAGAMAAIMRGEATAAQIAGFLMALRAKGERPEELVGLARAMRAAAVALPRAFEDVFDTCGTGGDNAGTVNVSSMAAVVIAACGVRVAKHGNRSVSSRSGSADVFEALGVNVAASPAVVARCLDEAGIAFLFAPAMHPSTRHVVAVRRELGVRTAFNLLGPLTNPTRPAHQIVGVPRPELTELIARTLARLGSARAWVVHGADGLDELSTTGYSKVSECRDGAVKTFYVHPSDVGLPKAPAAALAGGDAATNAGIVRDVLAGTRGPARDVVVLNAGAALFVAGRAARLSDGLAAAAAAIDSGAAQRTLDALVHWSAAPPPPLGETAS